MDKLKEYIKEKRANLSASSLTTYTSILFNLYKKVFGTDNIDFEKFEDTTKIIEHLKDTPASRRKTILSALVVITNNNKYRELMSEDISNYNHEISKQEKTETQKENWLSNEEINDTFNKYKKEAELLYKKQHLTMADMQTIQDFIILCLLSGIYMSIQKTWEWLL